MHDKVELEFEFMEDCNIQLDQKSDFLFSYLSSLANLPDKTPKSFDYRLMIRL